MVSVLKEFTQLPLLPSERDPVIEKPSSKWKRKRAKDDDDDEIEHTGLVSIALLFTCC